MQLYQIFKDNKTGGEAKYIQLVNAIKKTIEKGGLKKTDQLPSITEFRKNLGLGKETILKAFDLLKKEGLIKAVHGKGFFVDKIRLSSEFRLFVLFDEFSPYKKNLYYSMTNSLSGKGEMQIFFHHYNADLFNQLVTENLGNYTHYVIMPFPDNKIAQTLKLIPKDKLYLLDRNEVMIENIPAVFQDYEKDVFAGMKDIKDKLLKYEKLFLVYPSHLNYPLSIIKGFERGCDNLNIAGEVVESVNPAYLKAGHAWFIIEDNDLVNVVEEVRNRQWKIGQDLGVVSYNDTPMKRIAAGGITTLSVDFCDMGKTMIKMILTGKDNQVRCFGKVINRGSL